MLLDIMLEYSLYMNRERGQVDSARIMSGLETPLTTRIGVLSLLGADISLQEPVILGNTLPGLGAGNISIGDILSRYSGFTADRVAAWQQVFDPDSKPGAYDFVVAEQKELKLTPPRYTQDERRAHKFRSGRLRLVTAPYGVTERSSLAWQLQEDENASVKTGVAAMSRQSRRLHKNTQGEGELHRAHTPYIAGLMSEPTTHRLFMRGIDQAAEEESAELKKEARTKGGLTADVIVIGSGTNAAIFNATLRALYPSARIVSVDKGKRLGGQYRTYGDRPVFWTNSRDFRPQDNNAIGLPGGQGNLNSFGQRAPIQPTDISGTTYATNLDFGETAAINQFLSAETLLGVKVTSTPTLVNGQEQVTAYDPSTRKKLTLTGQVVINLSGPGERAKSNKAKGVWTTEEVLAHFGDTNNLFPMDEFIGKTILLKGGRDSGRIIAELFARLAPPEAYGKSVVQLGGPRKILWVGTDFETRDQFCETNRTRYTQLGAFLPDIVGGNALLMPTAEKTIATKRMPDTGELVTTLANGKKCTSDILIEATNLKRPSLIDRSDVSRLSTIESTIDGLGTEKAIIALLCGPNYYVAGTAFDSPLTQIESRSFDRRIAENTLAIWKQTTRLQALAAVISSRLQLAS